MSRSSDDESSDSSCEFLVSPDKINLDSKFFAKPAPKPNLKTVTNNSSDESDDDFDDQNENVSSSELLAQVLKNLENAKKQYSFCNENENNATTSAQTSGEKTKGLAPAAENGKNLSNEIEDLLLQGESGAIASTSFKNEIKDENENDEGDQDVKEEYSIPKEGVKITLPGENLIFMKRKKKGLDLQTILKNRLNQQLRAHQVFIHKVGLLCWLGHGFHLNRQINDPEVLASALSLVTSSSYPKGRIDLTYLEKITKWFRKVISMDDGGEEDIVSTESLKEALKKKAARNYRELVLLYVATLRAIGLNCRLVVSLRAPPLKLSRDQLFIPNDPKEKKEKPELIVKSEKESKKKTTGKNKRPKLSNEKTAPVKIASENSSTARKQANEEAKKKAAAILKGKPVKRTVAMRNNAAESGKSVLDDNRKQGGSNSIDEENEGSPVKVMRLRSKTLAGKLATIVAKKDNAKIAKASSKTNNAKNDVAEASEDEENFPKKSLRSSSKGSKVPLSNEIDEPSKGKRTTRASGTNKAIKSGKVLKANAKESKKSLKRGSKASASVPESDDTEYESETEFESESEPESESESEHEIKPSSKRKSITGKKRTVSRDKGKRVKRKLLSSDDEDTANVSGKAKKTQDIWVEVYVESEENWISVSVPDDKIHCTTEIYKKAASPVLYVIAWNSSGSLRDVTRRYCPQWLTVTRKQRVDEKWWNESLTPWKENETALTKAEDELLLQRELEQPLPKTVGECKGHPLYALTRHLLKYEALYPPDAKPLGFLKTGEAVYSRHCVHTLCSRETWVKNARVVKPGEQCYKVVKAMPKFDRLSGVKLKDQPLELFGKWQTGPFVPPEAKDGIVPRNEYGNVDLFKQCMLPKGTVHITLPALNRVARKLNIDCAPAVVGFNFGGRGALPAFEGFIVCEEFEDTLREAWEVEQVEAAKRARERVEKRVYGNWRKLIKGLFIRERLAAKYEFKDEEEEPNVSKKSANQNKARGTGRKTRGKRGK